MPYKNREVRLAYARCYRAAHPEKFADYEARRSWASKRQAWEAWVAAHPERRAEINAKAYRRYVETHREQVREKVTRRRARLMGATVEKVDRVEVYRKADGICGICGEAVAADRFEVDHILPLSRGGAHSYANTQPSHPLCNRRKRGEPEYVAIAEARLNGTQRGMGLSA